MHCKPASLLLLFIVVVRNVASAENLVYFLKPVADFPECLKHKYPVLCLKEKTLPPSWTILRYISALLRYKKNPDYVVNTSENEIISREESTRSSKLNDAILNKVQEFFKSRIVKFNLSNAFEARKGGGGGGGGGGGKGGKGGGMAMMVLAGVGAMVANMMMGKMALMAGSALMIAKISLILSIIMIVKKMQGGGGGGTEEKHIVYATTSDSGHSHGGGGGWHRSLDDAQNMAYRGQWGASAENSSERYPVIINYHVYFVPGERIKLYPIRTYKRIC
ncbi:hypothetical protein NQ315_002029 [Exocentrus adspersus]|uniref:Uncharacterized protein n=1 Tax=Exocentrus adspersus TaxID=1586481 RepID=A0AAV8V9J4_9CUCU|nr:hypothetical protein NQ315_002029 [Exocentrus adspersus]